MHTHCVHPVRIDPAHTRVLGTRPTHKQATKLAALLEDTNHRPAPLSAETLDACIGVMNSFPTTERTAR